MFRRPRRGCLHTLVLFAATASAVAPTVVGAQGLPLASVFDEYARFLQLTGRLPVTPATVRGGSATNLTTSLAPRDTGTPTGLDARLADAGWDADRGFTLLPADVRFFANTDRPWGVNDAAVWQGKGLTYALTGGVAGRIGPVTLTLQPLLTHSENRAIALSPLAGAAGYSPYAYPTLTGLKIDAPQRFGPDPFTVLDWGQSGISADLRGVGVGFSHENLWWGPGIRNAITMTNNAGGFWHAYVGTSQPTRTAVGAFSARWIWGSLRESQWFDTIPSNDRRFITGAVVSYSPKWASGLELGGTRTFLSAWREGGPSVADLLLIVKPIEKNSQITPSNPTGEDEQDQMASLFLRWAMPAAGFELYGEWGKGDHSKDLRDLFIQPEHASGWLFGFQKALAQGETTSWRLLSELTLLGAPRTTQTRSRGAGFFYVHGLIPQGHTHRGQVMGAGIGPGSSQLMLRLDRYAGWGSAGLSVLRTVYDNDRFYRQPPPQDLNAHEVEPTFAADVLMIRGPWDFSGAIAASRLLNQHYIPKNDHWNLNLALTSRYHPRRRE